MDYRAPSPHAVRPTSRGFWLAVDVVAAVVLAAMFSVAAYMKTGLSPALVAVAAAYLPIAVRRLWPLGVLVAVLVAAMVAVIVGLPESFLAVAIVLYTVGSGEVRRRACLGLALSLAGVALAQFLAGGSVFPQTVSEVLFGWLLMSTSWIVGVAVRQKTIDAIRTAERLAAEAVADERLRIARDLHDVVAHSMSLITARAGVAGLIADEQPHEARIALRLIEETGRAAMVEMRAMLGVLRSGTGISSVDRAPSLGEIPTLAAGTGIPVDVNIDLEVAPPEGVSLSIYRIVQEALTNVVKHAGPARCRVTVTSRNPGVVDVEVVDDGQGAPGLVTGSGHGLAGMRERTRIYGGVLTAGPLPEGGFRVHARIPLGGELQ
ncbi:sensor histidine kinase [Rhodococcus sp. ACT016]|uniref:sensor histidine kinase n=1 Tax=Rhodococcus sp. ACT016 TaxID=3134808 RepID=UPI003D2E6E19